MSTPKQDRRIGHDVRQHDRDAVAAFSPCACSQDATASAALPELGIGHALAEALDGRPLGEVANAVAEQSAKRRELRLVDRRAARPADRTASQGLSIAAPATGAAAAVVAVISSPPFVRPRPARERSSDAARRRPGSSGSALAATKLSHRQPGRLTPSRPLPRDRRGSQRQCAAAVFWAAIDHLGRAAGQLGHVVEAGREGADAGGRRAQLDDEVADLRLRDHGVEHVPALPAGPRVVAEDLAAPGR